MNEPSNRQFVSEAFRWRLSQRILTILAGLLEELLSSYADISPSSARANPKSLNALILRSLSIAGRFHSLSEISKYGSPNPASVEFGSKCNEAAQSLEDWASNSLKAKDHAANVKGDAVSSLQDQFGILIRTVSQNASELKDIAVRRITELAGAKPSLDLDINEDRYVSKALLRQYLGRTLDTTILKKIRLPKRVMSPPKGHKNGHWYSLREIWEVIAPHVQNGSLSDPNWIHKLEELKGEPDRIRWIDPRG